MQIIFLALPLLFPTLSVFKNCASVDFEKLLHYNLCSSVFQMDIQPNITLRHLSLLCIVIHPYCIFLKWQLSLSKHCIFSRKCQQCYCWASLCPRGQWGLNHEANKTVKSIAVTAPLFTQQNLRLQWGFYIIKARHRTADLHWFQVLDERINLTVIKNMM